MGPSSPYLGYPSQKFALPKRLRPAASTPSGRGPGGAKSFVRRRARHVEPRIRARIERSCPVRSREGPFGEVTGQPDERDKNPASTWRARGSADGSSTVATKQGCRPEKPPPPNLSKDSSRAAMRRDRRSGVSVPDPRTQLDGLTHGRAAEAAGDPLGARRSWTGRRARGRRSHARPCSPRPLPTRTGEPGVASRGAVARGCGQWGLRLRAVVRRLPGGSDTGVRSATLATRKAANHCPQPAHRRSPPQLSRARASAPPPRRAGRAAGRPRSRPTRCPRGRRRGPG